MTISKIIISLRLIKDSFNLGPTQLFNTLCINLDFLVRRFVSKLSQAKDRRT